MSSKKIEKEGYSIHNHPRVWWWMRTLLIIGVICGLYNYQHKKKTTNQSSNMSSAIASDICTDAVDVNLSRSTQRGALSIHENCISGMLSWPDGRVLNYDWPYVDMKIIVYNKGRQVCSPILVRKGQGYHRKGSSGDTWRIAGFEGVMKVSI